VHGRVEEESATDTAGPREVRRAVRLGAYAELVWPAVAGAALLGGFLAARAELEPLALGCYAAAYLVGGWEATRDGIRQLLKGRLDIDFLMVVAAIGAALVGEFAEGALLLFLFSLGHGLESLALDRARSAVSALAGLAPKRARVRGADGVEHEVPAEEVAIGDLVVAWPGERIPADGTIAEGRSAIDESPITGESMPVDKEQGASVFAGSLNGDGALVVRVTSLASDTLVARMVRLVAEAQATKSLAERAAERFTRVYVPCVLAATVLAVVVPPLAGWLPWDEAFRRAMSMLIGASPCALAISTPAAVLAGLARAARGGVLVKGGMHLEALGTLRAVAMDKTGTITRGKPVLAKAIAVDGVAEEELLRVAAAVESASSHPIARAVVDAALARGLSLPVVGNAVAVRGKGVEADVDGVRAGVGRASLFASSDSSDATRAAGDACEPLRAQLEVEAMTAMSVVLGGRALGAIGVRDTPRPEAAEAIAALGKLGCEVTMLTGDNAATATAVAREVGVGTVRAGLLPQQKIDEVQALVARHGSVAMVGDGINDAPALAAATVGIAMGHGGTDVALEAADVALMSDDLTRLPFAIDLGRATRAMIRQNVIFSMGVVAILIPLTLFGTVPLSIAVICHEGSTVLVALHGLRLLSRRDPYRRGKRVARG
jgi:Cd2+/Zn2+-exporting ATPase